MSGCCYDKEVRIINVTCHPVVIKLIWQHLQLGKTNWFPSHQIRNIWLQYLQSVTDRWVSSHLHPSPLTSHLFFFSHMNHFISLTSFSCFLPHYSSVLLSASLLFSLSFRLPFSDRWCRSFGNRVRGQRWKFMLRVH